MVLFQKPPGGLFEKAVNSVFLIQRTSYNNLKLYLCIHDTASVCPSLCKTIISPDKNLACALIKLSPKIKVSQLLKRITGLNRQKIKRF